MSFDAGCNLLITRVDDLLYLAKDAGKNGVRCHEDNKK